MSKDFQIKPIGSINETNGDYCIKLDKEFIPGLSCIDGFSHLAVVWWGNLYDKPEFRSSLIVDKPYKKGPEKIGVFATRSPVRPNPILLTTVQVQKIDFEKGIIYTPYIDAENGTPVLDIKPYHPMERIKSCSVPEWCDNWPLWYEDTASYDWQKVFNF